MPEPSKSMLDDREPVADPAADPQFESSVYDFDCSAISAAATRWKLVEELFHAALAVPMPQRQPYLALACAGDTKLQSEVESLLAFDQFNDEAGEPQRPLEALVDRTAHELAGSTDSATGTRVGPYVLLRELGRGGMGTVYLAERADGQFQQKVALKVVNGLCSKSGRERFLAERQLLANLDHPNIARFLDGGETEQGQPYFAMEYLQGESITVYCARRASTTNERLEIFEQVCAAVHYAHQKLAIHRDLKPANILITTTPNGPVAKVLDFGIAKLIDSAAPSSSDITKDLTMEPRAMTPCYASPEQFRGRPVSTSSDVYSLGAVLYEMLCGHRPYILDGMSPGEMERAICQESPLPPSRAVFKDGSRRADPPVTLWRELQGDLDRITAMAMAKEPDKRYGSAQALAEDVRRYRGGFPVRANSGGFFYRLHKQWSRNRLAFSGAAILLVSWMVGTVMVVRESRKTRQREEQVRNLATALLVDVPETTFGLNTEERATVVKQALDSLSQLAHDRRSDPGLDLQRAKAYARVGDLQGHPMERSLGDSNGAEKSYLAALGILDRLAKANPRDVEVMHQQILARYRLGVLYSDARTAAMGAECLRKGAEVADVALAAAPTDNALQSDSASLFEALNRVDVTLQNLGESEKMLDRAFAIFHDLVERDPKNWEYRDGLANCYAGRKNLRSSQGRAAEALADARENLSLRQAMAQEAPKNVTARRNLMIAYAHVGDALGYPPVLNTGEPSAAVEYMRPMLALAQFLSDDDPTDMSALFDLAMARKRLVLTSIAAGDRVGVEPQLQAGWAETQRLLKTDPAHKRYLMLGVTFQSRLAEAAGLARAVDLAEPMFNQAQMMAENAVTLFPKDAESLLSVIEVEQLRLEMEAREKRRPQFLRSESVIVGVTDRWLERVPQIPSRVYMTYTELGRLNEKIGNDDQARRWYEKSLAGWQKLQDQKKVPAFRAQEPERAAHLLQALNAQPAARPIPERP